MSKRINVLSNIILFVVTIGLVAFSILKITNYGPQQGFVSVLLFIAGAVAAAVLNVIFHELGHVFAAKKNSFKITRVQMLFLQFTVNGGRVSFDFILPHGEVGSTETVPSSRENMLKRLKKVTLGGILASCVFCFISAVLAFSFYLVPLNAYCVLSAFLPISAYFLLNNALPMQNGSSLNDGAVVYSINKKYPSIDVRRAVLEIQSELYNGKSPAEIDEDLYFALPQLPEDDFNFLMLLTARYNYYLDKEDYDEAKKTIERLYSLIEYAPNYAVNALKTEILYAFCTFDFNEDRADELMYELEKYLNSVNDSVNLRAKLAYMLYVKKEKEYAKEFIDRGVKEADKMLLKGQAILEKKLFDKLEKDI